MDSCRLCGESVSDQNELFPISEDNQLPYIIQKHILTDVQPSNFAYHNICSSCKSTVKNWHTFWTKCMSVQKSLYSLESKKNETPDCSSSVESKCNPTSSLDFQDVSSSVQKSKSYYCIAEWCNNNNTTRSMFRLPQSYIRGNQWLTNCGRKDLLTADIKKRSSLYLCQDHFTPDMFTNHKKERLNRNAIPLLFSPPKSISRVVQLAKKLNSANSKKDGHISDNNMPLKKILPKEINFNPKEVRVSINSNSFQSLDESKSKSSSRDNFIMVTESPNFSDKSNINVKKADSSIEGKDDVEDVGFNVAVSPPKLDKVNEQCLSLRPEEELAMSCDESYFPASSLLVFPESVHRCTFCGEVFAIKNSLSSHIKTYHM